MTDALTTLDILRQSRELLTPRDQWIKGEYITGDWDEVTKSFKRDSLTACSVGAMLLARGMQDVGGFDNYEDAAQTFAADDSAFGAAVKALSTAIYDQGLIHYEPYAGDEHVSDESKRDPFGSHRNADYVENIINFNDYHTTTHADVLAAFDGAIRLVTV